MLCGTHFRGVRQRLMLRAAVDLRFDCLQPAASKTTTGGRVPSISIRALLTELHPSGVLGSMVGEAASRAATPSASTESWHLSRRLGLQ